MRRNQHGFSHLIVFVLIVLVFGGVVLVGLKVVKKSNVAKNNSSNTVESTTDQDKSASYSEPSPLKNIGFNLDYYDPKTKRAGDIHFADSLTKVILSDSIYGKKIWFDYGIANPHDPGRRNVEMLFRLPLGTKVMAPIDGEVIWVNKLYSDDWSIGFSRGPTDPWSYNTEHVINPSVKVGDKVSAGQFVAEVSTHDSIHHPGFGVYELALNKQKEGKPFCPLQYLEESVKSDLFAKITAFYKSWEGHVNDDTIYQQEKYPVPGCATLDSVN